MTLVTKATTSRLSHNGCAFMVSATMRIALSKYDEMSTSLSFAPWNCPKSKKGNMGIAFGCSSFRLTLSFA